MKRYAAHFVFLPEKGYLKQYVVEVEQGVVVSIFPLVEEVEDVEWFPGVIILSEEGEAGRYTASLYYPFDFIAMRPVAGTQRRLLQ